MDKTSVIVVSSCVALLGLNWMWASHTKEQEAEKAALVSTPTPGTTATDSAKTEQSAAAATPAEQTPSPAAEAAAAAPQQSTQPAATPAPAPVELKTLCTLTGKNAAGDAEVAKFNIQNIGGGIRNIEMLGNGQLIDSTEPQLGNVKINGVTPEGRKHYGIGTLMFNLGNDQEPIYDDSEYTVTEQTADSVTLTSTTVEHNGVTFTVTKKFSLVPLQQGEKTIDGNAYVVRLNIDVTNNSNAKLNLSNWGVYAGNTAPVNQNESSAYTYYITMENGDFETESPGSFESMFGSDKSRIYRTDCDSLQWAGLMNQYYATIIRAEDSGSGTNTIYAEPVTVTPTGSATKVKGLILAYGMPSVNLSAGQNSQTFSYRMFTGPKYNLMLDDMVGQENFFLIDDIMDYGWVYYISFAMNWMINTFAGWFGNWGVAIIVMTFVIRLLIWPLYRKSYMSMKRMSLLQPMMQEIKQRCGDDRQRASMEMMALYKKYNISPLGGCLPLLLQIPIFFAFFYVLQTAAELRGAEFVFWVTDLSQQDTIFHILGLPVNVLPFIMAASMVAMMKMSPSAGDPMQQKIMKWMPVLFFLFCYTYPSALALYWTTTNIISIIQTLIIRRLPQPTLEEAAAGAAAHNGKPKKEGFFAKIQRMAEEQQKQLEEQKRRGGHKRR